MSLSKKKYRFRGFVDDISKIKIECFTCKQILSADKFYNDGCRITQRDCRECLRKKREKTKINCFEAYGGCSCSCCGERELDFLTLDHINNDGAEMRATTGLFGGQSFYRYLQLNSFPDHSKYQVLCMNCQLGKKIRGICPHKKR